LLERVLQKVAMSTLARDASPAIAEDWLLGAQLGLGSTAKVYQCLWHGHDAAVKIFENTRRAQCAFVKEMNVLRSIDHPNLVRVLEVCGGEGSSMIFMELCEVGCAFHFLHSRGDDTLDLPQQVAMLSPIASAMEYLHLHRPQIMHRDLKSLNVLLKKAVKSEQGIPHVQLADFGSSRMKEVGSCSKWGPMTKNVGTCLWMAPEMVSGRYDEKVDVYSFGIFLFEVLAQELPFDGIKGINVPQAACNGERPCLDLVPHWVPATLSSLMVRCWSHCSARPSFSSICAAIAEEREATSALVISL